MNLKDYSQVELDSMSYDDIAYLILQESKRKTKLLDLFKKVCKVLNLPESILEEKITDFFEMLSINKKFVMLPNGYWDLAINHLQDVVIEDEEGDISPDEIEDEDNKDDEYEEEEEENYYEDDLDAMDDDSDDDLKDLVIIDEDSEL